MLRASIRCICYITIWSDSIYGFVIYFLLFVVVVQEPSICHSGRLRGSRVHVLPPGPPNPLLLLLHQLTHVLHHHAERVQLRSVPVTLPSELLHQPPSTLLPVPATPGAPATTTADDDVQQHSLNATDTALSAAATRNLHEADIPTAGTFIPAFTPTSAIPVLHNDAVSPITASAAVRNICSTCAAIFHVCPATAILDVHFHPAAVSGLGPTSTIPDFCPSTATAAGPVSELSTAAASAIPAAPVAGFSIDAGATDAAAGKITGLPAAAAADPQPECPEAKFPRKGRVWVRPESHPDQLHWRNGLPEPRGARDQSDRRAGVQLGFRIARASPKSVLQVNQDQDEY